MDIESVAMAEEFAARNSALLEAVGAEATKHSALLDSTAADSAKHSALLESIRVEATKYVSRLDADYQTVAAGLRDSGLVADIENSFALAAEMKAQLAPLFGPNSEVARAVQHLVDQDAAIRKAAIEHLNPPASPEPYASGLAWDAVIMPRPHSFTPPKPVIQELPERTIIRREVRRRVGFAPFE
jgi:hypothetical protein